MNESMNALADEALAAESTRLAKSSRLHWFHWAIVGFSLALTLFVANYFQEQVDARAKHQFDQAATRVLEQIVERLRKYEDALWSGAAAIRSHGGAVSRNQWQTFAENLRIEQVYPGINGIGVIQRVEIDQLSAFVEQQNQRRGKFSVFPAHEQNESLPIVYIEPEAPNLLAIGLDIAHESNRYQAAIQARDTGLAQITGPIVLVQDEDNTPGFLFYVPLYREGTLPTAYSRRKGFLGLVYAPFVVNRLVAGMLDQEKRSVSLRILDDQQPIYDSEEREESVPQFEETASLELFGRTWEIEIWSNEKFREATETKQPLFLLLAGILIDVLLLYLFLRQSRASRRALAYADRLTIEMREQKDALESANLELGKANADLESFAYVASHDLKTPLRAIRDLTSYIEEDLLEYVQGPDANPGIAKNIKRLYKQEKRMGELICGILEYSNIDGDEDIGEVNVRQATNAIAMELNVRFDQIEFCQFNPVFRTYSNRFQRVLSHLLNNAFKYHPDIGEAKVKIESKDSGEFFEISVTDNGDGIEPEYQDRIFEPFQALQAKDEIEGTGIGLALVKKTVTGVGGQIWLKSVPGTGTTFTFLWPKSVNEVLQHV